MEALFLGTGGGRMCTTKQMRRTGGVYLDLDTVKILVDPGPGSLIHAIDQKIRLDKLDYLLVTHAHIDHCNDAEAIMEGMTSGATHKRGILITNSTVLHGTVNSEEKFDQKIDSYHQKALENVIEIKNNEKIRVGAYDISFMKTKHGDPNTLAFKIKKKGFCLGYLTDTIYFPELANFFKDCKFMFINLLRPHEKPWKGHLSTNDALELINQIKPQKVVFHHFGLAMIYGSIKKEEWWLKKNLKIPCEIKFAKDFQKISFNGSKDKRNSLTRFLK